MSKVDLTNLADFSMLELFRMEVETQSAILTEGVLGLEQDADATERLRELMRAAHSLKGAARIVRREAAVRIAHAMEDCFVAVQEKKQTLSAGLIDVLLGGIDLLNRAAQVSDETLESWEASQRQEIDTFLTSLTSLSQALGTPGPAGRGTDEGPEPRAFESSPDAAGRTLRITADNLDRLMGLAGEALVTARYMDDFSVSMLREKRLQNRLGQVLDGLRDMLPEASLSEGAAGRLSELRSGVASCQQSLAERLSNLDSFHLRFAAFSARLYREVLECRMRPFADGIQGFRRMVRDVARSLGKNVRLEVTGESTPVDRDILEKLNAPLDHLLRNSLDHGIETPGARRERGKPEEGHLQLQACHRAGMLLVTVADDGGGIDAEAVRKAVVQRKLTTTETAQKMTEAELLEFLFLPGFTLKESVSEISGRGVGLDVVKTMVQEVGGRIRISSRKGHGASFQVELPLTLSVVRTLLVEIGGEPYAFPLARIDRALKLPAERIESLQDRQHFVLGEERIGLVSARQVFDVEASPPIDGEVSVLVFGDRVLGNRVLGDNAGRYGLLIDRFLGEQELVVRTLDPRLGKVKNISSAALLRDGSPVLIVDVDDLKRSIETLASNRQLSRVASGVETETVKPRKHVLVVDDSLTVRELERKLLDSRGYAVDVAVDGMDGWNAARTGHFDLVVTDVDMPRLDGIELLKLIRKDTRLHALPVMIVSYKDREEDRNRGLEAGADYYLTKASFHDETLVRVVADLIGGAGS